LALAPRQLVRPSTSVTCESYRFQHCDSPSHPISFAARRIHLKGHRDILCGGQKTEEAMILEYKSNTPPNSNSVTVACAAQLAPKDDTTSFLKSTQGTNEGHQGGLSAARWSCEKYYFACLDGEIQIDQNRPPKRSRSERV
jgi:hypothetical protein